MIASLLFFIKSIMYLSSNRTNRTQVCILFVYKLTVCDSWAICLKQGYRKFGLLPAGERVDLGLVHLAR